MRFTILRDPDDFCKYDDILGMPDLTRGELDYEVRRRNLSSESLRCRKERSITIAGWNGKTLKFLRNTIGIDNLVLFRDKDQVPEGFDPDAGIDPDYAVVEKPAARSAIPLKSLFNQPLPLP